MLQHSDAVNHFRAKRGMIGMLLQALLRTRFILDDDVSVAVDVNVESSWTCRRGPLTCTVS
jgi:hypothetical protein